MYSRTATTGMRRNGLLPIKIAVLALIAVVVALTAITNFTDVFGRFTQQSGGQLDASERQNIRNNCMAQRFQACEGLSSGSTDWAQSASYEGKTCEAWHEDNQIFGENSEIPPC